MQSHTKNVAVFSASHFFVDFACAFGIFSALYGAEHWATYLLIYNFCAFALQLPVGMLADKAKNNGIFASLGALLVAGAFLITNVPYLCVAVFGLGNSFFHVGAGRDVLLAGGGKYTALGVFVSPGALGLFAGTLLGKADIALSLYNQKIIVATVLFILALIILRLRDSEAAQPAQKSDEPKAWIFAASLCLFVVVCLRAYVGMALIFPWKTTVWYGLASVLALASGKALGGLLADRFGAAKTSLATLALCAILAFFWQNPVCGLVSIILFNMTMPISLGAVYHHLPTRPGTGFGLLTLALFLGTLPTLLGNAAASWFMPYGFAAAAVASAALLFFGLRQEHE